MSLRHCTLFGDHPGWVNGFSDSDISTPTKSVLPIFYSQMRITHLFASVNKFLFAFANKSLFTNANKSNQVWEPEYHLDVYRAPDTPRGPITSMGWRLPLSVTLGVFLQSFGPVQGVFRKFQKTQKLLFFQGPLPDRGGTSPSEYLLPPRGTQKTPPPPHEFLNLIYSHLWINSCAHRQL